MSDQTSNDGGRHRIIMVLLLGLVTLLSTLGCMKLGAELYLSQQDVVEARRIATYWKSRAIANRPPDPSTQP